MIPPTFDYLVPATLPEAIALLHEHGDEAKVLAGGHSLIPAMRLRFAEPSHLIDISHIPGLDYVREEGGFLKIGTMAREVVLEDLPWISERYPLLVDTTKMIADPQVRNLATVGGNLAHGDPANDPLRPCWPTELKLRSPGLLEPGRCRLMSFSLISSQRHWSMERFSLRLEFQFLLPGVEAVT